MTRWTMATAGLLLCAGVARADMPPLPETACDHKTVGAACSYTYYGDEPTDVRTYEGSCQKVKYRNKKSVEIEVVRCQPKDKAPDKSNDKKKSALGAEGARGSLALALLACGAGVLMARRRHTRP